MSDATPAPAVERAGTPHPASERAKQPREAEPREELPTREGSDLITAAARAGHGRDKLNAEEQVNALEWFLSDTDAADLTNSFQINVGSQTQKRWVTWTVRPVDMDKLRRIRRSSQAGNRRERRSGTGDFDEVAANVQIVLEGTVDPDLRQASKDLGIVDPADAVRTRFGHKPGLLAQIAGEIMSVSGYDDEDVREVDAARG